MIKERHSTEQIIQDIWLSQKYMEYQAVGHISFLTTGNECQSNANMMENNSRFRHSIQKQPKLELEKGIDYEDKKGKR